VKLSDEAMRLSEAGRTYDEIAARLGCSRPTIAKAIGHWHRSRNLPEPIGRRSRGDADRGCLRPEPSEITGIEPAPPAA
jgi:hypothetical protein